jgi:hypothetical protein
MRRFGAGLKIFVKRARTAVTSAPGAFVAKPRNTDAPPIRITIQIQPPPRPGKSARFKVELDGLETEGTTRLTCSISCDCLQLWRASDSLNRNPMQG